MHSPSSKALACGLVCAVTACLPLADKAQTPNGPITFTNTQQPTNQENATGLVLADFAHHGNLQDAVIANDGSVQIAIPVNDPATGNLTWNNYRAGAGPDQIVTADFNHDGNLDLAIQDGQEKRITILLGNGDGSFRAAPDLVLEGTPRAMVANDFDGDGFADLAVVVCTTATVCTLERYKANPHVNSEGQFVLQQTISLPGTTQPQRPGMMTCVDFNKDGLNDVALIADNRMVMVFTSSRNGDPTSPYNGKLTLRTQFSLPDSATATAIAWGSMHAATPPVPDLVVRTLDACGASCGYKNSAYVFLNDGTGLFRNSARIALEPSSAGGLIGVADVNGDQKEDVVALSSDPNHPMLEYALGLGGGTFAATVQVMQVPHAPNAPGAASQPRGFVMRDINRDSRIDIAFAGYDAIGDDMAGSFYLENDDAATNCAPPSPAALGVRVCRPVTNATARAHVAFPVSAAGNSPAGVKRLELWVNGRKAFETWSDQMLHWLSLDQGTYRIVVIAVDMADTHVGSAPLSVHVQ